AARYADEWNGVFVTPQQFADLNSRLDQLLAAEGRQPEDLRRSLMTGAVYGRNEAEVRQKLESRGVSAEKLRGRGIVVGHGDRFVEQVAAYEEAGGYRILLQWLDLDDMDGLESMANTLLPQV